MAFLYQLDRDGTPLENWPVPDAGLVVGRGELAGATVNDESLSRSHFLILREAGSYFIIDLESQNGTQVNGEPVAGMKLRPRSVISAGQSLFYFSLERLPIHTPPILVVPPAAVAAQVATERAQV
jgi:predicted component of type VI protein secretion system